jgi:hypothetical protein
MIQRELEGDELLAALGELQRAEREQLAHWEEPAQQLAAQEPERTRALEKRLVRELLDAPARDRARVRTRVASAAAISFAMAAVVMLWVGRSPVAHELSYTLVPPAFDAVTRGPAAPREAGVYSLGRTLTFDLRPRSRYSGPLALSLYAARGGEVVALRPEVTHDPAGGVRVVLPTADGKLSEGSWELLFYLALERAVLISDDQLQRRECPAGTHCLVFGARFVSPDAP